MWKRPSVSTNHQPPTTNHFLPSPQPLESELGEILIGLRGEHAVADVMRVAHAVEVGHQVDQCFGPDSDAPGGGNVACELFDDEDDAEPPKAPENGWAIWVPFDPNGVY